MKSFTPFLAWSILAGSALGKPAALPTDFGLPKLKEQVVASPDWIVRGVPDPQTTIRLRFALKQSNIEGLLAKQSVRGEVPQLTDEEIDSYLAPAPETVATVKSWLLSAGIAESDIKQPAVDNLYVTLPISRIEPLLKTKYSLFSHASLSDPIPRTLSYSLPANIHGLIDIVQPTTAMAARSSRLEIEVRDSYEDVQDSALDKRARSTTCDPNSISTSCLLSYYNSDYTTTNQLGSQVATAGINRTPANHTDFRSYQVVFQTGAPDFGDIFAGGNPGTATGEGNADTQLAGGMAGASQSYYIFMQDISDVSAYVAQQNSAAPASISISYGSNEASNSAAYLTRVCNDFAVGLFRGVSVFVASGDTGVQAFNDPGATSCPNGFRPSFPSTCPQVTSVGATGVFAGKPWDPSKQEVVEIASFDFASGGGFSNFFAMPNFQKSAVQSYIAGLNGKYDGQYNKSGRAYPDIAALGQRLTLVLNNGATTFSGTSASSPIFAGVTSIINDYQVSRKHSRIVVWNAALYPGGQLANGSKDIVSGNQNSCGGSGFPLAKGWDPVTGNGTPVINVYRVLAP